MVVTKEVLCKSALSKSRIEPFDYSISPYVGCEHACVYCYARFTLRFRRDKQSAQWGDFVDAKVNAPMVLLKDLRGKPKGLTWLSAVTDPYQPAEKKYNLTRTCLEVLLGRKFPIWIQTKSATVLRDLDLISRFSEKDVGFTILTLNDDLRKQIEPGASPVDDRVAALADMSEKGIRTFAFVGPILPLLSDSEENLTQLARQLVKSRTSHILFDKLNLRWGVWPSVKGFLEREYPDLLPKYQEIMWKQTSYFENLKRRIMKVCKDAGVGSYEVCY
jgi:DNA repair photolyase